MKAKYFLITFLILFFAFAGTRESRALTIDFEGLSDLEVITTQFAGLGVTFSNTITLTAGFSLNEFEFPPHSGNNVASDDTGPMTLIFSMPMVDFEAYFTYAAPLTLAFYDALNNLEGTVNSAFSSNTGLSGDPGSSPNEFLNFASVLGISSVIITGDPSGGSFTMDDITASPVPEPGTLMLLGSGIWGMVGYRLTKRHKE